ncbi:right-handed parallel beta-helix repeat-containing protein, partial [Gelidibacter sp. F2691]|nr:right-handed parallel beta-helix repeat-containing protein [Gelidibacter sp. F2691]
MVEGKTKDKNTLIIEPILLNMNTTRIPLLFLLLFSTVLSAQIYVSPNGTGDGSSWAQASSIEDALANATSNQTLWLRRGTYAISTMLEIDYSQDGLRFFGGFVGTETALSQRDWAANVTILDGLTTTQIIHINGNDCVFDGITFVRGFTTGDVTATNTGGGAMYVGGGNNIIRNCTFRNNVSTSARGAGAMYIRSGTGHLVQNCTFENNRNPTVNYPSGQNGGGAIHNWTGNVTIQNSRFINNYSGQSGGAIYTWGQNLTLNNCVFNNNRTDGYGGAVHVNYFDTTFSNCNFQGNQSGGSGGAISNQHIISVNNSQFNGNTAQENGGAIYERGKISTILNSAFISNSAQVNGGAIYSNPPFAGDYLSISNILFYNNSSSSYGGAIYNGSDIRITNSTFVNNTNTALVHHFRESSTYYTYNTTVNNSIFYNNTKHTGLQYPDIAPYSSNDISDKDFRRNLLQENPLGVGNVLGVNPLFINAATGNFRLQINSPAIEYGRNILYTNVRGTGLGTDTDLGGDPRLFGTYVDAGAYERQSASTLTPPSCISTITPANNATNVAVNTNITWNSVATAIGYRISIGTTSGGTELVNNADVTTGTSYNPATDFPEDTEIFISVIPYNSVGPTTGCSGISFTTETLATIPGCATITSPT